MDTVTVDKADLLAKVEENRAKHIEENVLAMVKWRELLAERLVLEWYHATQHDDVDLNFSKLPKPMAFTEDYDTAIAMLRWEQGEQVELDEHTFKNLVLNQWSWGGKFAASNTAYLVT